MFLETYVKVNKAGLIYTIFHRFYLVQMRYSIDVPRNKTVKR